MICSCFICKIFLDFAAATNFFYSTRVLTNPNFWLGHWPSYKTSLFLFISLLGYLTSLPFSYYLDFISHLSLWAREGLPSWCRIDPFTYESWQVHFVSCTIVQFFCTEIRKKLESSFLHESRLLVQVVVMIIEH